VSWKFRTGLGIIVLYLLFALLAPYMVNTENIKNWNSQTYWDSTPKLAPPEWINFLGKDLPLTEELKVKEVSKNIYEAEYDFHYSKAPTDIIITFNGTPGMKITLNMTTPLGKELTLYSGPPIILDLAKSYPVVQSIAQSVSKDFDENDIITLMGTGKAANLIFCKKEKNSWVPVNGRYVFTIKAESKPTVKVVGKVYGIFGTDIIGRDIWSAFLWGARPTLIFVFALSGTAVIIGTILGLLGALSSRAGIITDFISKVSAMLPMIPIIIAIIPAVQKIGYYGSLEVPTGIFALVIGVILSGRISRDIKSIVMVEKSKEYSKASTVLGGSEWWIVKHHMTKIVAPYALSEFILLSAKAIAIISILGFFGAIPGFNWGGLLALMIKEKTLYSRAWWMVVPIGATMAVLAMGFVLLHLEIYERFIRPWKT